MVTLKQNEQNYLEWMRAWTEEDKKVVLLLIGFDLATVSLVLSEKIFNLQPKSWLVATAVLCLIVSAVCLYEYFHALHRAVRQMLPLVLSGGVTEADEIFNKVAHKYLIYFWVGYILIPIGLIVLLAEYARFLI